MNFKTPLMSQGLRGNLEIPHLTRRNRSCDWQVWGCLLYILRGINHTMKMMRIICEEEFPYICMWAASALHFCKSYPELSHGVDMLRFQKGVVIAVHQTFAVDHSCVVHQYCNIPHLRLESTTMRGGKTKKKTKKPNTNTGKHLVHFLSAFMRWYSCAAPELSAISPALIQIFQMKFNLYTRWETEQLRANTHTEETGRHPREIFCDVFFFTRVTFLFVRVGNIFINMKPAYLFSNHLGLLVDFLPIGHIAQEVMALCSWERDLFSCFLEALFCPPP